MNIPQFALPILLRKMEQLYQINFENIAYICAVSDSINNNEYSLLSTEQIQETAIDEAKLCEIKFDSITEVIYQTKTGKYSFSNPVSQSGPRQVLSLVLCFRYDSKLCFIDIQNQLFHEMFDFTEASILADADLKNWLDQHSNFNEHILFLSSS